MSPDAVYRALSADAVQDWRALAATSLAADPRLVATTEVEPAPEGWAALLRHERIPFVSYPYEWPFSMLKDAALLQLELLRRALGEGLTLKDASPYNVQWRGARPVFVDVGSFERLATGRAVGRLPAVLHALPLSADARRPTGTCRSNRWLRG